jgi:hypothetical protein
MKDKTKIYEKPVIGSMGLKKNKILRVPIDNDLMAQINKSITRLQESGLIEVSVTAFCRQALREYTRKCINERLGLVFEPQPTRKDKVRIVDEVEDEENKSY